MKKLNKDQKIQIKRAIGIGEKSVTEIAKELGVAPNVVNYYKVHYFRGMNLPNYRSRDKIPAMLSSGLECPKRESPKGEARRMTGSGKIALDAARIKSVDFGTEDGELILRINYIF